MFAKSVLDNGIRVVSQEMTDHRSVSLGIWVENGSRHELPDENGISHFIEHLLFKGTTTRTAAQIAEEMDAVGGLLNAFTSKEHTCYYAKVLDEDLPLASDLHHVLLRLSSEVLARCPALRRPAVVDHGDADAVDRQ